MRFVVHTQYKVRKSRYRGGTDRETLVLCRQEVESGHGRPGLSGLLSLIFFLRFYSQQQANLIPGLNLSALGIFSTGLSVLPPPAGPRGVPPSAPYHPFAVSSSVSRGSLRLGTSRQHSYSAMLSKGKSVYLHSGFVGDYYSSESFSSGRLTLIQALNVCSQTW